MQTNNLRPGVSTLLAIAALSSSLLAAPPVNPLTGAQKHALALQTDGTVCTNGENTYGQLGDGTSTDRHAPVHLTAVSGATMVSSGWFHGLALKSDGTVWAWGYDGDGELGDASPYEKPTPIQVPGLSGMVWVSAGNRHSLAVKNDGTVWAWGSNSNGQLGDGTLVGKNIPVQVINLTGVVAVAAGNAYSLALKSDGTVWGWGYNGNGQLGDGTLTQRTSAVQVTGLTGVMSLAAGFAHSLALKTDGTVWSWGYNANGQLGDGSNTSRSNIVRAGTLTGIVSIAVGDDHSIAAANDGSVFVWGLNSSGQLGLGNTTAHNSPVQVTGFTNASAVGAGSTFSWVLKGDGSLFAWGNNASGQLANGSVTSSLVPVAASACASGVFTGAGQSYVADRLTARQNFSLALKSDATVVGSGDNTYGMLGDGTTTSHNVFAPSAGLSGMTILAGGYFHSLGLKSDGTVWAWGYGGDGQLGNGGNVSKPTPIQVPNLTGIVDIAAGGRFSLALKSDGTVLAWGSNGNGQLGDGTLLGKNAPVQVINLNNVVAIAAGASSSFALKSDGTVWSWGYNGTGQLGDGTVTQRTSPVKVTGLTGVIRVEAGDAHTLALKSDGTLWAWGYNANSQLGDGSNVFQVNPVRVSDLVGVIAMAAGDNHSLAVESDGSVWAWGFNGQGQLGIGSTVAQQNAVKVTGISNVLAVAAGTSHSLALTSDGKIWAWGLNNLGQFGIATPASSTVPIMSFQAGLPPPAVLGIAKSHSGNFAPAQAGATYTITVSNSGTAGPTNGAVTATDTLPAGLSLVSMTGTGWNCSSNSCTRSDILFPGQSYPAITVTVNVAANATSPQVNQASVSGGGSGTSGISDSTVISANPPTLTLGPANPLNFHYSGTLITSPQTVIVSFTNGSANWIASSNQSNITISPTSGSGTGTFRVTVAPGASGVITVTAPGALNSPQQIQVNVASASIANPLGSFDTPVNNTTGVAGAVPVTGWVIDNIEPVKVDIWREPVGSEPAGLVYIGDAVFVVGARPDVQGGNPTAPYNYRAGWGYLMLTNFLPGGNGVFKLHAIAHNSAGGSTDLGTKTITVDNAHASRPFGTIDTPGQGGTASGTQFINFGWALTQNPYAIPIDGSTLTVYVDGVPVGHPTYNQPRSDISTLFPGLANSNGAIGYFFLNTTTMTNAVHTISWVAYDNANPPRGDGLGSRYFNVLNTTQGAAAEMDASVVPAHRQEGVRARTGFNAARERQRMTSGPGGWYYIAAEEVDRIEVDAGAVSGSLWVNGARLPLPIGSTLRGGVFYWQPGPGFLGDYLLLLNRPDGEQVPVHVRIVPKRFQNDASQ